MFCTLNNFEHHISQYISSLSLLDKDELYLVALSGGADSVSLLRCLYALGYHIEAVHCNFHLRGEESICDENFCKELCKKINIRLHLTHFNTVTYAQTHKVSIEMAARDLRYCYFNELIDTCHAAGICVGHHKEDSVETILINLVRSTGIHGLTGISPKNGKIFRPLLCVSKKEIISYLDSLQQHYVTDSTNLVADVQRNKMRLEVIPNLEKVTPAAQQNILKTAERLSSIVELLDTYMAEHAQWKQKKQYLSFPIAQITNEYILWYLLKNYQFTPAQTEQIYNNLHGESGKVWASATHQLLFDREEILLAPHSVFTTQQIEVQKIGTYSYNSSIELNISLEHNNDNFHIIKDKKFAFLDASCVRFPLTIRPNTIGDRFQPFGMKGTKMLSDYMTNHKMSVFDKHLQLVVTDANNQILWVVNDRIADWCKITNKTSKILKIEYKNKF